MALQLSRYHSCAHTRIHTLEGFTLSFLCFLFPLTVLLPAPSVHPCSFDWRQLWIYWNFLFNHHLYLYVVVAKHIIPPCTSFPMCVWVCVRRMESGNKSVVPSAFNQCAWYQNSKASYHSNRLDYQSLQLAKSANWHVSHPQLNSFKIPLVYIPAENSLLKVSQKQYFALQISKFYLALSVLLPSVFHCLCRVIPSPRPTFTAVCFPEKYGSLCFFVLELRTII